MTNGGEQPGIDPQLLSEGIARPNGFDANLKQVVAINKDRLVGAHHVVYGGATDQVKVARAWLPVEMQITALREPREKGEKSSDDMGVEVPSGVLVGKLQREIYDSLSLTPLKPLIVRHVVLPYEIMADTNRRVTSDTLDWRRTALKNMKNNALEAGRVFYNPDPKALRDNDKVFQEWTETTALEYPSTIVYLVDGTLGEEAGWTAAKQLKWMSGFMKSRLIDMREVRTHFPLTRSDTGEWNVGEDGEDKQLRGIAALEEVLSNPRLTHPDRNTFVVYATDGKGGSQENKRAGESLKRILPKVHGFFYTEFRKDVPNSPFIDNVNMHLQASTAVVRGDEYIFGGLQKHFQLTESNLTGK